MHEDGGNPLPMMAPGNPREGFNTLNAQDMARTRGPEQHTHTHTHTAKARMAGSNHATQQPQGLCF